MLRLLFGSVCKVSKKAGIKSGSFWINHRTPMNQDPLLSVWWIQNMHEAILFGNFQQCLFKPIGIINGKRIGGRI
jgi:hypothetical protein